MKIKQKVNKKNINRKERKYTVNGNYPIRKDFYF